MSIRTGGPAPKRSAERVRRNDPLIPVKTIDVSKLISEKVEIPEPSPQWHSVARNWYDSLAHSAQAVYYEPSDWALAYTIAEAMSRDLKPQFIGMQTDADGSTTPHTGTLPIKGASLTAYLRAMNALLVTETDRLKAGIEIKRATQLEVAEDGTTPDNVVDFATARRASVQSG